MVFNLLGLTRDSILEPLGLLPFTGSFFFELIDMIIMSIAIEYIFSDYIRPDKIENYDPLKPRKNAWEKVKFAAIAAGPAVVFHELAHKFVAMAFGATATLYAPYGFYIIVSVLKAIGFPFLFLIGGFVVHSPLPALPSALVSIAGPAVNFLTYFIIKYLVQKRKIKTKYLPIVVPLGKISLFLGIFNLIPFPGFDGFQFLRSLARIFI